MGSEATGVDYRELRREDLPSFEGVTMQGLGRLERATGLDESAKAQFGSLRRRGVWALFSLFRALGRPPIRIYVGVAGGKVVGTASEILLRRSAYVLGVATDASMRRHGIATRLMELAHLEAKRRGKDWAALDVESDNEAAIGVYRRLGYVEAARFSWHVGAVPEASLGEAEVVPLHGPQLRDAAAWVSSNAPSAVTGPLPPSARVFTHLEVLVRSPRARVTTWKIDRSGQTGAVLRATYTPMVKTGYVLPVAQKANIGGDEVRSAIGAAGGWVRSLGGSKLVVVAPGSSAAWSAGLDGLGIPTEVSTTLMVRRLDAPGP